MCLLLCTKVLFHFKVKSIFIKKRTVMCSTVMISQDLNEFKNRSGPTSLKAENCVFVVLRDFSDEGRHIYIYIITSEYNFYIFICLNC